MRIVRAAPGEEALLGGLAHSLWPHHTREELTALYAGELREAEKAFFFVKDGEAPLGFAACSLRQDYVEGTNTSPVGYLEGIYIAPQCRNQGLARRLLLACENWARELKCREFASDCEIGNEASIQFHRRAGFSEENRIVCFAKKL